MKVYASSTLFWGCEFEDICRTVAELQLEGIELWAEQVWYQKWAVNEMDRLIKQYDLKTTLHAASWDLNLCSLNQGIYVQSIKEIERSFALAASLRAYNVTVHPGRRTLTQEWIAWHRHRMEAALTIIEELAQLYDIVVSLELMEPADREFVFLPQVMNEIVEPFSESIMTTFDAAHTPLQSSPLLYYKELDRVNKIHLSDAAPNRYHLQLGKGELAIEPLLKELESRDLPVVLEGYDPAANHRLIHGHVAYLKSFNILPSGLF